MPELMTEPLAETADGTISPGTPASLGRMLEGKTVLAIGPGLGLHPETQAFARALLRDTAIPAVIDADGLNAFAGRIDELRGEDRRPVVITPHPGEMARLTGKDITDRIGVAREFAVSHNLHVVLKGFRTVIAAPDGAVRINPTGNPGMATGGTGDILTGMIAGLIAQDHLGSLLERLCLAVYLHGLAGDIAAEKVGQETMVATDILRFLNDAWKQLREG
jgi:NAD(P)H-hydrate epimerase